MREKRLIKVWQTFVVTCLALVMTLGYAVPTGSVFADSPVGGATQVAYRHNKGHDYEVQDPDWVHVFCLDPAKSYSDKARWNMNYRWKSNFMDNADRWDNVVVGAVNGSHKPNSSQLNRLVSILWYAQQLNADVEDTQKAVWYFATQGADDNYQGNVSKYNNYIVKAAGDSNWAVPDNYSLYLYEGDTNATQIVQAMVRLETNSTPSNPPEPPAKPEWSISTTVVAGGVESAADGHAVLYLEDGKTEIEGLEILDKIQYSNMPAGHKFWTLTRIMDYETKKPPESLVEYGTEVDEDGNKIVIADHSYRSLGDGDPNGNGMPLNEEYWIWNGETIASDSGSGEWAYPNSTGMWRTLGEGKYYMVMSVYDADIGQSVTIDGYDDEREMFEIKSIDKDAPSIDLNFQLTKKIVGEGAPALKDAQFEFKLAGLAAGSSIVGSNTRIVNEKGTLRRPITVNITKAGEYNFSLEEVTNSQTTKAPEGVKLDAGSKKINVKVVEQNGELVPTVTVDGKEIPQTTVFHMDNANGVPGYEIGEFVNSYEKPEEPSPTNGTLKTTVSAGGQTGTASNEVKLTVAQSGTVTSVTDKIDYEGLTAGATYTVKGTLRNVTDGKDVATAEEKLKTEAANGTWEITFSSVKLEAGKKYVVYEEAVNTENSNDKAEHKDDNDKAQTIVVEEPKNESNDGGRIATTAEVDGKKASKDAAVEVESGTKDVKDTIDYSDLVKGNTYSVKGTLYNVTDKKDVATVTEEKVAEDTKGTWEITFKGVALEAGKTYVVFEEATPIKNAEGKEIKDGETLIHKDEGDKAQTVVVKTPEPENPTEPEKPTEPENPVNPDYSNIKISTQVQNQYLFPAKGQKVVDRVTYSGLDTSKTYVIMGTLNPKTSSMADFDAICDNKEFKPTSPDGYIDITFTVDASKLKQGDKLVAFEYLFEGSYDDIANNNNHPGDGKEVAKHEDINDAAQTETVVDGKLSVTKTTTVKNAKPGDSVPYTIKVSNERPVDAVVNVYDIIPEGLEFEEATFDGEFVDDEDNGHVVWTNVTVPANGSITVNATFTLSEDASGKVKNQAMVYDAYDSDFEGATDDDAAVLGVSEIDDDDTDEVVSKSKGANTGDDTPIAGTIIALLVAGGALEIMRRRRMN